MQKKSIFLNFFDKAFDINYLKSEKGKLRNLPFKNLVLRAGLEPARISPHAPQTCAATNYATSAVCFQKNYLFAGALAFAAGGAEFVAVLTSASNEFVAGVSISAPFELSGTMFVFAGSVCSPAAGASVVVSSVAVSAPCKTDTFPVNAGIESIRAESMKTMAAAIVSFDKTEAVPRGPKAALETLLVNSAPASVLPGCSKTVAIRTMQATKNIVYKTYINLANHLKPPEGGTQNYL